MKKMSEVFELPMSVDRYGLNDSKNKTIIDGYDAMDTHLEAAAHAINHVDALADALQELLNLACDSGLHNRKAVEKACLALNAYRGAK